MLKADDLLTFANAGRACSCAVAEQEVNSAWFLRGLSPVAWLRDRPGFMRSGLRIMILPIT